MKAKYTVFIIFFLIIFFNSNILIADSTYGHDMLHNISILVFQLGFILFAGYIGTLIAQRIRIPNIVGEVIMGIIIGPHLLGSIPLPIFSKGIFPIADNPLAISSELFAFAAVASIVLLFLTGLQTDLSLFLKFAFKGSFIGISSSFFSLLTGIAIGTIFLRNSFLHPANIVLGAAVIVTSIDISARILGENRKMASPEAVTILSASVFEEIIGISLIAIAVSISSAVLIDINTWKCGMEIASRALILWLAFTILGIILSRRISILFKKVKSHAQIAVLALGLAFIVSGIFETAGLALVIGAYVAGLALANTDISFVIQDKIETVHHFFDPIFFVVIGMIVNIRLLLSSEVILFGLIFGVLAWISKLIGCSIPALLSGFTTHGALRISLGMIPRGEVALIIGAIALGSELIDQSTFDLIIIMTLFTTLTAPPLFNKFLQSKKQATDKKIRQSNTEFTDFEFGSKEITNFLRQGIVETMQNEGFFVHNIHDDHRGTKVYEMRKDIVFISMICKKDSLHFISRHEDITLVNNIVYDAILTLHEKVQHIKSISKPLELKKRLIAKDSRTLVDWYKYLSPECIDLDLKVETKEEAIISLIELLYKAGKISDLEEVKQKVFEREASMSTGMQYGIALPHARSETIRKLAVAVGICREGIDFKSLDNEPAKFIYLVVSPQEHSGPHLQILAGISGILNSESARNDILKLKNRKDLLEYMVKKSIV